MKPGRRYILKSALAVCVAALAGCGSPIVSEYRLAAVAGPARNLGRMNVSVRGVTIPGYLDQNAILKAGSAYQVARFTDAAWAEPLADMLQSVLVADVSQRLPGASVFADGAIGAPADVTMEVAVQRFDLDPDGSLNLTAQLGVRAGAGWTTRRFHASAAPAGTDAANIAAAMSQLWGQAADALAAMVGNGGLPS